ncbi:cathepsin L isoform X3 [Anabrus simplex]|uniref:cathepsin L isoform X3 n=1 Tax=Anabrus simplex TaxID=316456 RepID=UPI0035A36530
MSHHLNSMKIFMLLCTFFSVIRANEMDWDNFKIVYHRKYASPLEEQHRKKIYMENKQKITEHNKRFMDGEVSYTMRLNEYGDMNFTEFHASFIASGGGNYTMNVTKGRDLWAEKYVPTADKELPSEVDWRKKGAVTPARKQGGCGSCWAFTAEGPCRYNASDIGATLTGFVSVPDGNYQALKDVLANIGPVGAVFDASMETLQFYSSGVYHDPTCRSGIYDLNHDVLVIGYGTENGTDFWIIKNSWGETWGENGFLKISTATNSCGLASYASYPLITDSGEEINLELLVIIYCFLFITVSK